MEPTYLIHYGIKGQKHGVRRFQNDDGSLTPEGKDRYRIDDGKNKKSKLTITEKIQKYKNERPESSTWKSKEAKKLDDAELNRRISRLQREQQYKNLSKSNKRKAAEWIAKTAGVIFVATAVKVAAGKMAKTYNKIDLVDLIPPNIKMSDLELRKG